MHHFVRLVNISNCVTIIIDVLLVKSYTFYIIHTEVLMVMIVTITSITCYNSARSLLNYPSSSVRCHVRQCVLCMLFVLNYVLHCIFNFGFVRSSVSGADSPGLKKRALSFSTGLKSVV